MAMFVPPYVHVGMVVWWYPSADPEQHPHPAFVSGVGTNGICCVNIISPNSFNFWIRDGVRHVDDPEARRPEQREMGVWDHTPTGKHLVRLLQQAEKSAEKKST